MSRCFPYPPPGYEKKPQQLPDLVVPTKVIQKDRHKHKDKKKKKKKEGDTNGDAHDKDSLRSSKLQRTALVNDLLHHHSKEEKQNGRVRGELQASAAVERPLAKGEARDGGKTPARGLSERPLTVSGHQLYNIKQESNGKVDPKPPIVLQPKISSSLPAPPAPSKPSNIIPPSLPSNNVVSQRQQKAPNLPSSSACEMPVLPQPDTWSATADEDWLFARKPLQSHSKPKAEVDGGPEGPNLQVWAEAVYLPSVDIYALPYVVPY